VMPTYGLCACKLLTVVPGFARPAGPQAACIPTAVPSRIAGSRDGQQAQSTRLVRGMPFRCDGCEPPDLMR
jgi:hypothetical protein